MPRAFPAMGLPALAGSSATEQRSRCEHWRDVLMAVVAKRRRPLFQHFAYAALMLVLVPGALAFVFGWFAFRSRVTGVYRSIITQALTYALMLGFLFATPVLWLSGTVLIAVGLALWGLGAARQPVGPGGPYR